MPLFYQQNINDTTRLAIWHILEPEDFFTSKVTVQRSITHQHKRLQHLAGRYLLLHLFPGFPFSEIEVAETRKPFLPNEQYHFSISHCSDYAAAIVSSDKRVGVDVEVITGRLERIKQKFLHADEVRFVNTQSAGNHLALLTILWSAKEAMYKWYGLGEVDFRQMMRTFAFEFGNEGDIDAAFMKEDLLQKLRLHYNLMEDLSLVWVMT